MIDHTGIGVVDVARSAIFYDATLGALGFRRVMQLPPNDGADAVGYGVDYPVFWIDRFHPHSVRQHTAFVARSRTEVDAFYTAALKAGGTDNGGLGRGGQIITLRSCSILTVTTSRRSSEATDTRHQAEAASAESHLWTARRMRRMLRSILANWSGALRRSAA